MVEVKWTPQAINDIEAVAEFIALDSPHYASLFVIEILESVDRLELFPKLGRIVPEAGDPSIREVIHGNYRIVYRVKSETVDILTIYHGARLLDPKILEQTP